MQALRAVSSRPLPQAIEEEASMALEAVVDVFACVSEPQEALTPSW